MNILKNLLKRIYLDEFIIGHWSQSGLMPISGAFKKRPLKEFI